MGKKHYRWTERDEENLAKISWIGEKYKEEFVEEFYRYLENFPDIDKEIIERHKEQIKKWFLSLFTLKDNQEDLKSLYQIGLPLHYITSFAREYITQKITKEMGYGPEVIEIITSINKAIDINLEFIINSLRKEESGKYEGMLIKNIRRVSWFFDAFIILTLAVVGLFLIVWIIYEFWLVVNGSLPLERGGLSILGSVLILYAISELLREEIKHIRGSPLSLKVFVGVALAAVIRKILIISLSPEKVEELITLSLVILALGVVFWFIYKVESKT